MSRTNSIKTDMGYLGENYQHLLVKYFIENPKFFIGLVSIIDQNMFTEEHLRRIVGMMKDRYTKNGLCPNYYDIELLIRTTVTDKITVDLMIEKLNLLKSKQFDIDIDLLTSNAEKFFHQKKSYNSYLFQNCSYLCHHSSLIFLSPSFIFLVKKSLNDL